MVVSVCLHALVISAFWLQLSTTVCCASKLRIHFKSTYNKFYNNSNNILNHRTKKSYYAIPYEPASAERTSQSDWGMPHLDPAKMNEKLIADEVSGFKLSGYMGLTD